MFTPENNFQVQASDSNGVLGGYQQRSARNPMQFITGHLIGYKQNKNRVC